MTGEIGKSSTHPDTETKPAHRLFKGEGKNIILGITGTSGAIYGIRTLYALLNSGFNVDLILTEYAHFSLYKECGIEIKPSTIRNLFPDIAYREESVYFHNNLDLKSEMFSSDYRINGMIVAPCAVNYIAGIANGESKNLIEKCADHTLSYGKPLVVVPRETPVNKLFLKNLQQIIECGGKIVPAMPPFDFYPQNISDLADYIASLALELLNAPPQEK